MWMKVILPSSVTALCWQYHYMHCVIYVICYKFFCRYIISVARDDVHPFLPPIR